MRTLRWLGAVGLVLVAITWMRPTYDPASYSVDPRFGLVSLSAQTLASSTTLSAAITDSATSMTVASATGFTVGNKALIDNEVVAITSVSGTVIGIRRAVGAMPASGHASGNTVITGASNHFYSRDPDYKAACDRGTATSPDDNATYLPWINDQTGVVWNCRQTDVWWGTTLMPLTYNSLQTFTG